MANGLNLASELIFCSDWFEWLWAFENTIQASQMF